MSRGNSDNSGFSLVAAALAIIIGILWMPIAGAMTDDTKPVNLMTKLGFSDIRILEKDSSFVFWKGCGNDDSALYKMQGVNPAGQTVTLDVCAGVFKGATPRG